MDAAFAAWFGGLHVLTKMAIGIGLVVGFVYLLSLIFQLTSYLYHEVFDGEGFELRKIPYFLLFILFGTISFFIFLLGALSVADNLKDSNDKWN